MCILRFRVHIVAMMCRRNKSVETDNISASRLRLFLTTCYGVVVVTSVVGNWSKGTCVNYSALQLQLQLQLQLHPGYSVRRTGRFRDVLFFCYQPNLNDFIAATVAAKDNLCAAVFVTGGHYGRDLAGQLQ